MTHRVTVPVTRYRRLVEGEDRVVEVAAFVAPGDTVRVTFPGATQWTEFEVRTVGPGGRCSLVVVKYEQGRLL